MKVNEVKTEKLEEQEINLTMSIEETAITVDLYVDRLIDILDEETDDEDTKTEIIFMFVEMIDALKDFAMPDTIDKYNEIMVEINDTYIDEPEGEDIIDEPTNIETKNEPDIIDLVVETDKEEPVISEVIKSVENI